MTRRALLLLCAALVCFCWLRTSTPPSSSADRDDVQESRAVTPDQALRRLKDGNDRFVANGGTRHELGLAKRQQLAKGQAPFAAVLTCADSRLAPEFIFDQGLGDLFVVRVAGNVAEPFGLGSLEYAVEHLHVPLVVLLGHEECGAVAAALDKARPGGNLEKLIGTIHVGSDPPKLRATALAAAVENNVRYQTRALTGQSPLIRDEAAKGKIRIVSGIYHLASGKVDWLADK